MTKKKLDLKATITLSQDELRQLVADHIRAEYGVDVRPERVKWSYAGSYGEQEFDGASIEVSLGDLKGDNA